MDKPSALEVWWSWIMGLPLLLLAVGSWCWEHLPEALECTVQYLLSWCAKVVRLVGYAVAIAIFITAIILVMPIMLIAGILGIFESDRG